MCYRCSLNWFGLIGGDLISSVENMTFSNYHVIPSMEYIVHPNDTVLYRLTDSVESCVNDSNSSMLVTYNYITGICLYVSIEDIDRKQLARNYYSTAFFHILGRVLQNEFFIINMFCFLWHCRQCNYVNFVSTSLKKIKF